MKNVQSQKMILGALAVVIFAVVFYQLSWKARASTLEKASDVRAETELKRADLIAAQKAQAQKAENEAALQQIQAALPSSADAQGLIRQLTQVALASGVTWDNVNLGDAAAPGSSGLQELPITVTISGQIANLEAYLANIRSPEFARLITIDGLVATFNADKLDPSIVSEVVTMRAFTYGVQSGAQTTASSVAGSTAAAVTQTPVGTVPKAMPDNTNVEATPTTVAAQG